jgi:SAM-dependent methyltransferase
MQAQHLAERAPQAGQKAHAMWSKGDFARVGARLVLASELLCRSIDIRADERVLDVAAGSGNTAIAAARRGGRVTASDIVESLLQTAQARAELEGLPLATSVADAQSLPFDDGSFDVVLSTFGAMFAPDQQLAADELLRVCRPGGRIGLANWVPDGLMANNQALVARYVPPPAATAPPHRPAEWGSESRVRELFGERVREVRSEHRTIDRCAAAAEELVEFNLTWFGPLRAAYERLDDAAQQALRTDLTVSFESFNRANDGTLVAQAAYLEVVATTA